MNSEFFKFQFSSFNLKYPGFALPPSIFARVLSTISESNSVPLPPTRLSQRENMEFDSIITAVQTGKVDVGAAGMTVTEDRLKNVDFSNSYTTSKQVIIVKVFT